MKTKKIIIAVSIIIAILLIGIGTVYSIYSQEPKEQNEETKKPNKANPDNVNDPENFKIAELESIKTPDNKLRLAKTKVYESNGITGMMLNVIPYEDLDNIYIKITIKLAKSKEEVVVYFENLRRTEQIEHEVQTLNDWSTLKSWSVEIITADEAMALGYTRSE